MATIKLVQGDTLPQLVVTLFDPRTDSLGNTTNYPIDLTDVVSSRMRLRVPGTTAIVDTLAGVVQSPATSGVLLFGLSAASLASSSSLEAEVEITMLGGGVFTVYDIIKIRVRSQFA